MKTLIAAVTVGLGLVAAAVTQMPGKQTTPPPCDSAHDPVATIGGAPITAAELDERIGDRLLAARTSEYEMRRGILSDLVSERLEEREAARRGISRDDLLAAEVAAKVAPVTEEEKRAHYEAVKGRVGNRPPEQVLADIENGLRQQRLDLRREAFAAELQASAHVELLLEPPRAREQLGDDPFWGPASAAVTIMEFSDFQCPYCARVAPTLKRIRETYGDQVRLVYRDFPLSFHPDAAKAAEAAACAGDQGKFWEMHDKIFENPGRMGVADLKTHAAELSLDAPAFAQCLDSGRKAPATKLDLEAGEAMGVTGTPAFLINGRLLTGARPFEHFAEVIDDELARARRSASKP
jgi:protein-disulfide isomerase